MFQALYGRILCVLFVATSASAFPTVRVQVLPAERQIEVSGFDLNFSHESGWARANTVLVTEKYYITANYLLWTIRSESGQALTLQAPVLKIRGENIKINGVHVPGDVEFFSHAQNRIKVIASLDLEDYLKGVVPSEMPASWPIEALKAQAIAARSYALATIRERSQEIYQLDSTTHHQVFNWLNFKGANVQYRDKITEAIESTRGQYLVSPDETRPFKSYYHSHCGGQTEEATFVWGVGAKSGLVKDAGCALDDKSKWKLLVSRANLANKIGSLKPDFKDLQINNIEILSLTDSARSDQVRISFNEDKYLDLTGQVLRSIVGFNLLKSTKFSIEKINNEEFLFTGRGYGHGVGLCQNGSRLMALAGAKYQEIIKRYFPRAKLILEPKTVASF